MHWKSLLAYAKAHVAMLGVALGWIVYTFPGTPASHYAAYAISLLTVLGVLATPNQLTAKQRTHLRTNPILPTGKKPARRDDRDLRMAKYIQRATSTLPPIPSGPLGIIPGGGLAGLTWGTLGNAQYGDCVFAGGDHETMIWTDEGTGTPAVFTDATALADYSAVTGFTPNDPSSDQGTNVRDAYTYRLNTGLVDAAGRRHKLGAYLAVDRDEAHFQTALDLFGVIGLGVLFPNSAMDQFNQGQPWDVVAGEPAPTEGHYVPLVGYDPTKRLYYVITWGKLQAVTWSFIAKYADEHYALLSPEMLKNGKSITGLNYTQLQADLNAINSTVNPTPSPSPSDTADQTLAAELHHLLALKSTSETAKADFQAWLDAKNL